ncbi:Intraflagellar transport protein 20, partial [Cladochytrium tenue]
TEEFNSIVQVFLGVLGEKAAQIEREKLKAIGMRNHAEREADSRAARLRELQLTIRERQAELQRLTAQHESLQSVLADQRSVIEQMSSK